MKNYSESITYTGAILDVWLPRRILYSQIPGLAVGIVYRGTLVYAKGFGYADVARGKKVTAQTCFRIASISKTFTAIAIAQLADTKKLRLGDRIGTHLSWVKGPLAKVTIKELLAHTSGTLRDGEESPWTSNMFPRLPTLKKWAARPLILSSYKNRFKYSNFGYALLGQVIENVSGLPYEDYVRENVLRKAGMPHTCVDFTPRSRKGLAIGYSRPFPEEKQRALGHISTNAFAAATGFLSNVTDLSNYLSAIVRKKLLSDRSWRGMARPLSQPRSDPKEGHYGLGLRIWNIAGHAAVGHTGSFAGFITAIALDPKSELGVIVLANSSDAPAGQISREILKMICTLQRIRRPYGKKKLRNAPRYAGTYRNQWEDKSIASLGNCLIAFDPERDSPLDDMAILSEKRPGVFLINTDDGFNSPGEEASFKGGGLRWGSKFCKRVR